MFKRFVHKVFNLPLTDRHFADAFSSKSRPSSPDLEKYRQHPLRAAIRKKHKKFG